MTNLQAQLAAALAAQHEAEARLAMVTEALQRIHKRIAITCVESKSRDDDRKCLADCYVDSGVPANDQAEHVAAFLDRVRAEGAAGELRAQHEALLREADSFDKKTAFAMRGISLRFLVRAAELQPGAQREVNPNESENQ